jgi:hypothetical protein
VTQSRRDFGICKRSSTLTTTRVPTRAVAIGASTVPAPSLRGFRALARDSYFWTRR